MLHLSPFNSISGISSRRESENSGFLVSLSQSVSNASRKCKSASGPGKQCGLAGKSYFCALDFSLFPWGRRGRQSCWEVAAPWELSVPSLASCCEPEKGHKW